MPRQGTREDHQNQRERNRQRLREIDQQLAEFRRRRREEQQQQRQQQQRQQQQLQQQQPQGELSYQLVETYQNASGLFTCWINSFLIPWRPHPFASQPFEDFNFSLFRHLNSSLTVLEERAREKGLEVRLDLDGLTFTSSTHSISLDIPTIAKYMFNVPMFILSPITTDANQDAND